MAVPGAGGCSTPDMSAHIKASAALTSSHSSPGNACESRTCRCCVRAPMGKVPGDVPEGQTTPHDAASTEEGGDAGGSGDDEGGREARQLRVTSVRCRGRRASPAPLGSCRFLPVPPPPPQPRRAPLPRRAAPADGGHCSMAAPVTSRPRRRGDRAGDRAVPSAAPPAATAPPAHLGLPGSLLCAGHREEEEEEEEPKSSFTGALSAPVLPMSPLTPLCPGKSLHTRTPGLPSLISPVAVSKGGEGRLGYLALKSNK